MTVHMRPTSIHPTVETFGELAAWLVRQIENLDADCNDDETIGSIGLDAHKRSLVRVAVYRDVLHQIAPAMLAGAEDAQRVAGEDSAEALWRERYPDADELTLRRLGGDR